jgi:hypothetical protein
MKTPQLLLIIGISLVLSHRSYSQTEQGSFRVGGGASFTKAVLNDNNSYRALSLDPSVSYFVVKNFSVGVAIPLAASSVKTSTSKYSTSRYSFGPQARYYFPFGNWAFFPEVLYSFGKSHSQTSGIGSGDPIIGKSETKFSEFRLGAGLTYFINRNVGIEGTLHYVDEHFENSIPFTVFNYDKSISFSVGFQIYLSRK